MATDTFSGLYSTDDIWVGTDTTRCLTNDINSINDAVDGLPNTYASKNHTHTGYAAANHTHDNYADKNHTHDNYFSTSGGTINGDTNIAGILRVNSQQSFFYKTDTQSQTVGTNNATGGTTICCGANANVTLNGANTKTPNVLPKANNTYYSGNSNYRWKGIYSTSAVNVSSDERLKENIEAINVDEAINLINGIEVKSFNYIDDDDKQIGIIAQDIVSASPELAKALVSQDDDGYYGVKTSDLVFPLIAVVQKLEKEVDALIKIVESLTKKSEETIEETPKSEDKDADSTKNTEEADASKE